MKKLSVSAVIALALFCKAAYAQTTSWMHIQYGLPNIGLNVGGGCSTSPYVSCFTIPAGKQLRECKGTLTLKQENIQVLAIIVDSTGSDVVVAMEAEQPGTLFWSSPTLSNSDPLLLGNGTNMIQIEWEADNNTGSAIAPGFAFEINGVCSTY
jgi:hypothetical protein